MLDLGWTELLVIGIVALIVVGPKDLPGMFRAVGNFVGKAKRMAREFSQAMNAAADDAGVGDVKKTLDAASNPMKSAMNEVNKSTEGFTERTMAGPRKKPSAEREAELAGERQTRDDQAQTPETEADAPRADATATSDATGDTAPKAPASDKARNTAGDEA